MKREQKMGLFGLVCVGFVTVVSVFQNCSKVNFKTNDPAIAQKGTELTVRKVTVDPAFNQQKADMKVLLVVDDSYTMIQSQTQLANAIDSLLNPLQGHNVEFKIVSTSGVPSNEVDYTLTTKYFSEQNIEIPESQLTGLSSYLIEKNVKTSSVNRHGLLKLYRESTTAQLDKLKTQIKAAIQSVGVNGSETEEGLCATARQIFDESASRFFKPGDKAAVVIMSDENDTSVFNKCSTRYRQRTSTKPVVYYNYGQQRAKVSLEYQMTRDGVTTWLPVAWGVSLSGARSIQAGDTCSEADKSDAVGKITYQGYVVRNVKSCIYEVIQASYYGADLGDDGSASDKNLCTMTTYFNGRNYANIYAMVNTIGLSAAADSCGKQLIPSHIVGEEVEYDSVIKSDSVAANAKDLNLAIMNKSNEVFGASGYFVANLIRQTGESCNLSSGQSYGIKYQELTQLLGPQRSIVKSLCNTDFSTTLAQVSEFIVTEAAKSFALPLQDGEVVLSVTILRATDRIKLTTSQFEAAQGTVTLTNFNLVQGDILEFELGPQ
jgi:hypothetical protein